MKTAFEKEQFLENIESTPFWVKNEKDLLKFCKHLQYRLLQQKSVNEWYAKNIGSLSAEKYLELSQIQKDYDDAYANQNQSLGDLSD